MTGYMPFGARRTMTQDESSLEVEENLEEDEIEESIKLIRLFISEHFKLYKVII